MRTIENHQCPVYAPFTNGNKLFQGVQHRADVEYARHLVGRLPTATDTDFWSPNGWCEKPKAELYSFEFILSANGKVVPEDLSPSLLKLDVLSDGFIIQNVTGIRTHIIRRLDGKGYDIRKLGHYSVRAGHVVYINDSSIFLTLSEDLGLPQDVMLRRDPDVQLRFFLSQVDPMFQVQTSLLDKLITEEIVTAFSASFGADLSLNRPSKDKTSRFGQGTGVPVYRDPSNLLGCSPYSQLYPDGVLMVDRGECTFLEKLLHSRAASASGVIVISDSDGIINPTASMEEIDAAGDLSGVGIVLLPKTSGQVILQLLEATEMGLGQMMVVLNPASPSAHTDTGHTPDTEGEKSEKDSNRILYINGHPLLNTRLLV